MRYIVGQACGWRVKNFVQMLEGRMILKEKNDN